MCRFFCGTSMCTEGLASASIRAGKQNNLITVTKIKNPMELLGTLSTNYLIQIIPNPNQLKFLTLHTILEMSHVHHIAYKIFMCRFLRTHGAD